MKGSFLFILFILINLCVKAQSKTTEALNKKYSDSKALFFYNNTLRMINQTDDKAFDALIKNIEKLKLLMITKTKNFKTTDYAKIVSDYKADAFEEIMTSRVQGKNFDIFVKEKNNKTKGMLVLVNDSSTLFVLDILGSIQLNQVTSLYNNLSKSSDVREKIKALTKVSNYKEEIKADNKH